MPLFDDQGRLFGRWNLVDAAAALFLLVLVPLGFGLYFLFRAVPPVIDSIEPRTIEEGIATKLRLTGQNLRPFMRVKLGNTLIGPLVLETPTRAEIRVPAMAQGTYDVALLDPTQEVARRPAALKVEAVRLNPRPLSASEGFAYRQTALQLVGEFDGLTPEKAAELKPGLSIGRIGRVLAVRPPLPGVQRVVLEGSTRLVIPAAGEMRVPAIVEVLCDLVRDLCALPDGVHDRMEDVSILLPYPGPPYNGPDQPPQAYFFVHEARPADSAVEFPASRLATVRLRIQDQPDVAPMLKVGDAEVNGAVVTASRAISPGDFELTLRLPVTSSARGWRYTGRLLKVGGSLRVETKQAIAEGVIQGVTIAPDEDDSK